MKLTKSKNIYCTGDRVATGNDGFWQMLIWWMDCSQETKDLLLDKFRIWLGKDKFMLFSLYSGKPLELC